ncbi:phage BR0599 family protein [Stutzerimonas stutzeri]|uniref:Phage BR0599 family protein n=1 Tax=Stutzerimonas stutzeri TaxID=316 RepID=A0AA42HCJ4_STUST|nr:phage BR0599 family protein [Stutzerimonas stutzeri]MDH0145134.1 phage BR0599 family protein [Stutzerimonas stutzeri]MDH0149611.1 phage BR0599 family protein [Stutzerimonas stutzeri]
MLSMSDIEASFGFGSPTELYLFEHGDDQYAYTSGSKKVMHTDGIIYIPLAIERGKLQRTQEDAKNRLSITLPGDSPIPMLFRNKQPSQHVSLRIFRFHRYTKEQLKWTGSERGVGNEYICAFSGEVIQTTWNNSLATLDCAPISALQRRQTLRFGYQSQCNHHLFDENCGLKIQDWQQTVTVTAINESGFKLEVSGKTSLDDYYRGGLISKNDDDFRDVVSVVGTTVELIAPFDGLKVGETLQITKGCDRSAASCQSFENFDNFFGCLTIPTENPFK